MEYKTSLFPAFACRFIELAPAGGIVGLVLPDPVLSGRFYARFRERLVKAFRVLKLRVLHQRKFKGPSFGHIVLVVLRKERGVDYEIMAQALDGDEVTISSSEILNRERIRWWVPRNKREHTLITGAMNGPKLAEFAEISSGLIGKQGRNSILGSLDAPRPFMPGVSNGSGIQAFSQPKADCGILFDRARLKSGFKKAR